MPNTVSTPCATSASTNAWPPLRMVIDKSLRAVVDDVAADDRHVDGRIPDGLDGAGEDVVGDHGEIGVLAGSDRTAVVVAEVRVRAAHGVRVHRLVERDALLGHPGCAVAAAPAGHRRVE